MRVCRLPWRRLSSSRASPPIWPPSREYPAPVVSLACVTVGSAIAFGPLAPLLGLGSLPNLAKSASTSAWGVEPQRAALEALKLYAMISRFSWGGNYTRSLVDNGAIAGALSSLQSRDERVRAHAFELLACVALDRHAVVGEICASGHLGPAVVARVIAARKSIERGGSSRSNGGPLEIGGLDDLAWALQCLANTMHWESSVDEVQVARRHPAHPARRRGRFSAVAGDSLPFREAVLGDGGASLASELVRLFVALDQATVREQVLVIGSALERGLLHEDDIPDLVLGSVSAEATMRLTVELLGHFLDGGSNDAVLRSICEHDGALATLATTCSSRPELQGTAAPLLFGVLCERLAAQRDDGAALQQPSPSECIVTAMHCHLREALLVASDDTGERVADVNIADVRDEASRASFAEGVSESIDALDGLQQVDAIVATVGATNGGAGAFAWLQEELKEPSYWELTGAVMWHASWTAAMWCGVRSVLSHAVLGRNVGPLSAVPRNAIVTGCVSATLILLADVAARARGDWATSVAYSLDSDAAAAAAAAAASVGGIGALHLLVRIAPLSFLPAATTLLFSTRFDRSDHHFDDTMSLVIDGDEEREGGQEYW